MIVDGIDLENRDELGDEEELVLVWHRNMPVEIAEAGRQALVENRIENTPPCA